MRGQLRPQAGPSVVRLSGFSSVGFSGSRHLSGAAFARCRSLAADAAAAGCVVSVGCATGADQAARFGVACIVHSGAVVFRAAGFAGWQLVARSVQFVRALASSPSPVLVSFPALPCPFGLQPSALSSRCFCGSGSGSWASLALAVGLAIPVFVFLPSGVLPPPSWGSWSQVGSGRLAGAWQLAPAAGGQRPLF